MNRRADAGAAAVPLLGAVLLVLLLVGALGLAEEARAAAMRTLATRAVAAAVESAARTPPTQAERVFQRVLKANLSAVPYSARLEIVGGTMTGRVEIPYRMEYLAAFGRETRLVVEQSISIPERKAKP